MPGFCDGLVRMCMLFRDGEGAAGTWFRGTVSKYISGTKFIVKYEDGDERKESFEQPDLIRLLQLPKPAVESDKRELHTHTQMQHEQHEQHERADARQGKYDVVPLLGSMMWSPS